MDDGVMVEGATVGDEGLIGLATFLGDGTATDDAICQVAGQAACLSTKEFRDAYTRSAPLQEVLRRYALALMGQLTRTAGCNRVHPIEERCARWLLMTRDRVGADEFPLTHDFLAAMLGVRRPSVTVAAGILQQAGLIDYRRGQMRILDGERLEAASCEDYRLTREIYEQLFGGA
jgi:CRP-like cAMP-binding protein